jgi:hypothetical protein
MADQRIMSILRGLMAEPASDHRGTIGQSGLPDWAAASPQLGVRRVTTCSRVEEQGRLWGAAMIFGIALAFVAGLLWSERGRSNEPANHSQTIAPSARREAIDFRLPPHTNPLASSGLIPAGDTKKVSDNGLSYETVIPRPTVKGYYEPKVIPYPTGKPVYVHGYYRKDGTYVRPHFRSLPRR